MEGAKQGGHMVILVVPGRNLSEELTLNLEFSPIVPWQQIQDPSASGWKLHILWTKLIGQEIWQRKTDSKCSCHILLIYVYNIYIVYIYYVFISMFLQIPMDTACQVFSILLLFFPTCFPHLKVAEFSEEFPKNYYDQAVEGGRCFGNICGWTACFYMSNISMITPPIHAFIWTSDRFCNDIPKCIFFHWYHRNSTYMWFQHRFSWCSMSFHTSRCVPKHFFPPCGKPIFGE